MTSRHISLNWSTYICSSSLLLRGVVLENIRVNGTERPKMWGLPVRGGQAFLPRILSCSSLCLKTVACTLYKIQLNYCNKLKIIVFLSDTYITILKEVHTVTMRDRHTDREEDIYIYI